MVSARAKRRAHPTWLDQTLDDLGLTMIEMPRAALFLAGWHSSVTGGKGGARAMYSAIFSSAHMQQSLNIRY